MLGLELAWDLGYRRVQLDSDSKVAVGLLENEINESHHDFGLVMATKRLMDRDWELCITHVNRESNNAADFLSKSGLAAQVEYQRISQASPELMQFLCLDCNSCSNSLGVC